MLRNKEGCGLIMRNASPLFFVELTLGLAKHEADKTRVCF